MPEAVAQTETLEGYEVEQCVICGKPAVRGRENAVYCGKECKKKGDARKKRIERAKKKGYGTGSLFKVKENLEAFIPLTHSCYDMSVELLEMYQSDNLTDREGEAFLDMSHYADAMNSITSSGRTNISDKELADAKAFEAGLKQLISEVKQRIQDEIPT